MHVFARAHERTCAVARNSQNSSLTPGYSIFAGMRETFDAIQSNRSTEVCSSVDISPPPCSIVERSIEKKKKNKQNAATLPGTRIAAIEIARWYEPDVFHHHIYLFIRFLFSLFGLVCFLPSFVLFLFRCHTGMQPLNQIKRGILCTPDDFSRNACARRSLPVSLIENNNEDKCVDARAIKVCADLE